MTTATRRQLPILFSPDLAQKVHLGLKTETRRLVKPHPNPNQLIYDCIWNKGGWAIWDAKDGKPWACTCKGGAPICQPGDLLYVRETWGMDNPDYVKDRQEWEGPPCPDVADVHYKGAEAHIRTLHIFPSNYWHPSIHMPKWAARTWLEVLSVSAERVQEINETGARCEGYAGGVSFSGFTPNREKFSQAWNARYPGSWDRNDWVFVYRFKKVEAPNVHS